MPRAVRGGSRGLVNSPALLKNQENAVFGLPAAAGKPHIQRVEDRLVPRWPGPMRQRSTSVNLPTACR